jgi:cytochrome b6
MNLLYADPAQLEVYQYHKARYNNPSSPFKAKWFNTSRDGYENVGKPRELTWVTGVALASVTVSFGVTGYSLPWDQVGYWACKIVTGVPEAIPIVGNLIVQVLRGGVSVGQSTLTRFYSAHTFVLPVVAAVLMLTHFVMIRKQGISGPL